LGIPQDKIAEIFNPFTQLHEFAGSQERGGVGLGLYITKTLLDLMGGTINVVSTEGQGSEFIVTLDLDIA
jgi:signal transduction histidine kinase